MAQRGQVTDEVKRVAAQTLGIQDIGTIELRLMPYIQWVMMNGQRVEPAKVNAAERRILSRWREAGWIEGGASGLSITKEFWDGINQILWVSYVAHGDYDLTA